MIRYLGLAAAIIAGSAVAQTTGGTVGGATAPYMPAGTMPAPGTRAAGSPAATPGSAVVPALPQPSTGVTPPIGAVVTGTIGDGRVGTPTPGGTASSGTNWQFEHHDDQPPAPLRATRRIS